MHLAFDYSIARRLKEDDAAYAGGMRPYASTQNLPEHQIGSLLCMIGNWSLDSGGTLFVNYEQLHAGEPLKRNGMPSGRYVYAGRTYRY
jgi:hypothetical protein